jgi:putrescine aminotransferase
MIPFGDLAALEQALADENAAAFIVEPIQGEGGVNVLPPDYLYEAHRLCQKACCLLILDEVQTGLGRTGTLFAAEYEKVVPDILCLAKALGGGVMPIGAFITRPGLWDKVFYGKDKYALHTSTFGGNSLAMAAGLTTLDTIIKNRLPKQAMEKGRYLTAKLNELKTKHKLIREIRGRGLLIGLEFHQPVQGLLNKLSGGTINKLAEEYFASLIAGELLNKHRILTAYTLNNPNVIRIEPPLIIDYPSLDRIVDALDKILARNFTGITLDSLRAVLQNKISNK